MDKIEKNIINFIRHAYLSGFLFLFHFLTKWLSDKVLMPMSVAE